MAMHRSGFAILLALLALAVGGTLVAGMLAQGGQHAARLRSVAGVLAREDQLASGEAFACRWLDAAAERLVLPPDGGGLLVADSAWTGPDARACRLAILVHDIHAALPRAALHAGHPWRLALPSPGTAPRLLGDPEALPPAELAAGIDLPAGWSLLPDRIPAGRPVGERLDLRSCSAGTALVAWIAVDNPGGINVNTAPEAMLRLACRSAGVDPAPILAARAAGRWSPATDSGEMPALLASSPRWGILIEVQTGGRRLVRWSLAERGQEGFAVVRRHAMDRP